jgi:diguanylate cyclase (GGDEF)-like protein
MSGNTVFAVCRHYHQEAEQARLTDKLDRTMVLPFPARCGRPKVSLDELTALLPSSEEISQVEVFGGFCLHGLADCSLSGVTFHIHQLEHCFCLVAEASLVTRCLKNGGFLTTPGWLGNWLEALEQLGLTPATARDIFAETTGTIVLLDTGVNQDSGLQLREFAAAVDRPYETIRCGISEMRLRFTRTHLSTLLVQERREAAAQITAAQQQTSHYAMSLDLLSNLAQTSSESEAVDAMLDVYTFLFAPERLCYLSFQDGRPDRLRLRPNEASEAERAAISERLTMFPYENDHLLTDQGFTLRIGRPQDVRGIISVERIAFPDYRDRYLNLALSIVNICELPIENARRYEKIVRTEEQLRKANESLYLMSTVDALTGIANRRAYNKCMEREWKKMLRNQSPLSLILADIDFFKDYNDFYGHKAGDSCLRRVAHLIRHAAVRPGDFVARYGGEEFAVILADTEAEGALHVAERIRSAIVAQQIAHHTSTIAPHITISLGVSLIKPPVLAGQTPEMLFRAADTALYEAKRQGRNRSVLNIIDPGES